MFVSAHQAVAAGPYIEQLYCNYRVLILAHLMRIVHDRELAEDLCQETFVKALRGWERRDQQGSVTGWLYRIATNCAYDHLRRCRRIRFLSLGEASHSYSDALAVEMGLDRDERVWLALAQLPLHYRQALVLIARGYTTQELAATIGCAPGTARTRLFRAREQFRRFYQES
ncbi:MAG: RNA polymerase sigma factor [Chloroflexales bacterium]|nr:RNA polymerase sigma factor [Chloroflexales bacterium]